MNKSDLIHHVADQVDLPKSTATKAFDAVIEAIQNALVEGDTVAIPGFGTFSVRERAARTGRNPRTGEAIQIAASRVPAFKPGKTLKDAVN
ncbi:MAG: HU family DNA-binding protein [Pseudomonadota bacterium]